MTQYTCAKCRSTFEPDPGWTDDDAKAEARELFGYELRPDDAEVLCDACYSEFLEWVKLLSPAERAELDKAGGYQRDDGD